ncbi:MULTISPECIES: HD domain-containing protein [unclassified Leptolyngbya]|uniref:HD domain-containing protein n=1 Tax=unclassified Leptolyngbya TaxID=2650499 RepID=UPI0016889119|nr:MULTISPECIES: HD domain-containing protein [unclassified Leptolyngbya]MBD1912883.1 HD domain-containing protein [Leptolyngbya sp. FACHB-8]MBD2154788.1 HD domain-containing protein [Leptolyngbya sp. FACHB-16]
MTASPSRSSSRTYHDPLHGAITLNRQRPDEALLVHLIDTPEFQRLRRIRQLGAASLTFHGAESSRFTHSLGVMAIARRAFDLLAQDNPELQPYRATVLCAALLHDLGHGPFSHTCEDIFGTHHEVWTGRILGESHAIREVLDSYDPELLGQLRQVYAKQHNVPLVWQLVSSQLDCDRLDYLMRDSYFTGASYGRLDLDRILMAMKFDPASQQLVVARKGITAIEHYLIVRFFMYAQIYHHPKNIAATWVLEQAFRRAKEHFAEGNLDADEVMAGWLRGDGDRLPLKHYLAADDNLFVYHLQRWQRHADPILADLCRRFMNRDLPKTLDISPYSSKAQQALLEALQPRLQQAGFVPNYYCGIRVAWNRGYTLYQRGIKLQTEDGLQEISDVSPLLRTLTQPLQKIWLVYPREIDPKVEMAIA